MERYDWIIISLIVIAFIAVFILKETLTNISTQPLLSCDGDSDCVPAQCCHPASCVNVNNKPDCSGIGCTAVCEPGTMDCGCGHCACVNNECKVIRTGDYEWC